MRDPWSSEKWHAPRNVLEGLGSCQHRHSRPERAVKGSDPRPPHANSYSRWTRPEANSA